MEYKSSLYLVPTPIGNLDDITIRAIDVLQNVDYILAEDTRTTGVLLKKHEIKNTLKSYHIHNEHQQLTRVVEDLKSGKIIALVSDAGTPAISDPGFLLVRACLEEEIAVECLPGATAFVPALVSSGMSSDKFVFEGFLPPKKGRQTRLKNLQDETRTICFYESPHRLVKTLEQFKDYFGKDRKVSISRELTKIFEEHIRGTLDDVLQQLQDTKIKGEIVIILEGKKD